MSQSFNIFLAVFAALFPIVNPLGGAPIFYQMTSGAPDKVRAEVARKVGLYGFFVLLGSMLIGSHVLTFFGISLPVLRLAGGVVVTSVGWQLLHQGNATPERNESNLNDNSAVEDMAFYPLTMPLTMGPGSIATAVALGAQSGSQDKSWATIGIDGLAAICGLLAISVTVYFAYRYASEIERVLGRNGTNILVRLFAFILLCIGMQIMWTGTSELIASLHTAS